MRLLLSALGVVTLSQLALGCGEAIGDGGDAPADLSGDRASDSQQSGAVSRAAGTAAHFGSAPVAQGPTVEVPVGAPAAPVAPVGALPPGGQQLGSPPPGVAPASAPPSPPPQPQEAPGMGLVLAAEDVPDLVSPPAALEPVATATNPFVSVSHDPLSTFAVDVDTASYDIFRRDVLAGRLPSPQSVRVEEFVNYFGYDYPAPEPGADEPFSISLAAAPNLIDNGTTLLRVGIQGELPPEFEKKAANLVFLIDTSGSMQSAVKLPLVKRVLTDALTVLDPADTVSLVTYASGTRVALPPTSVDSAATIAAAIEGLSAGGSTNGAGGIQLAYQQAEAGMVEGGINHVVLCTDGDFNVGVSSNDGLVALIEEERKSGVTFTALGFGARNNDAMMEAVSNAGNGVYGVIANEDQAADYVQNRLLHNLHFIAKDVKLQVEFNPELVEAYRLVGYENRAIADVDFRNDVVDAGEIGAGHRVTALYELVLAGNQLPGGEDAPELMDGADFDGQREVSAEDLVLVKVRYKEVGATEEDAAMEVNQGLTPDQIGADSRELDPDFRWAVAVAAMAELLKGSPYMSAGVLNSIQRIVDEQQAMDSDRREFAQLFASARPMLDAAQ